MRGSVTACLCDGQTPQPIVTQNGLNDVDSDKDVPFGVKIETFGTT